MNEAEELLLSDADTGEVLQLMKTARLDLQQASDECYQHASPYLHPTTPLHTTVKLFFFSRFRLYLFSNSLFLLALNPPMVNPS